MQNPRVVHALDVQEIVYCITRYLNINDIIVCCSVSKKFYDYFSHIIWQDVQLMKYSSVNVKTIRKEKPWARLIDLNVAERNSGVISYLARTLQKQAQYIQHLVIHDHKTFQHFNFGRYCTQLQSIDMDSIHNIDNPKLFDKEYLKTLKILIKQNSLTLNSLSLKNWDVRLRNKPLSTWNPILSCSQHINLRFLCIKMSRIRNRQLEAFWDLCQRLERLELDNVRIDLTIQPSEIKRAKSNENYIGTTPTLVQTEQAKSNFLVRFPKLRTLILRQMNRTKAIRQLELIICHCPELGSLDWCLPYRMAFPEKEFSNYFEFPIWPRLHSITTNHRDRIKEETVIKILESCRSQPSPVKILDIPFPIIGPKIFDTMKVIFSSLTRVNLLLASKDNDIDMSAGVSDWIQQVLESCPALERIRGKILNAKDIIGGKPWVCLGLYEFNVMINMDFSDCSALPGAGVRSLRKRSDKLSVDERDQCIAIYESLSRLTKLRVLNMCIECWLRNKNMNFVSLPLQLDAGLHLLSSLWRLNLLGYHGCQDMQRKDIDWIITNWPDLKAIRGDRLSTKRAKSNNSLYIRDFIFVNVLGEHGITTNRRRFNSIEWELDAKRQNLDYHTLEDSSSETESDN